MLSASILLMAMNRPRPALPASLKTRRVVTPMPLWALIVDDHRIDGMHGADRLPDEVGVAGRVDRIEPLAVVVEVDHVGLDRVAVHLLFLVEIADARALVDAGRTRDVPVRERILSKRAVFPAAPCPPKATLRMSETGMFAIAR